MKLICEICERELSDDEIDFTACTICIKRKQNEKAFKKKLKQMREQKIIKK